MVFGWRRAFCTSVPREPDSDSIKHSRANNNNNNTPKTGGRFVFFSSSSTSTPSTPRLHVETDSGPNLRCRTRTTTTTTTTATVPEKSASVPVSPKLHCKTSNSPKLFQWSSTPSSPRSPSTFSFLKANLRFSTNNRCGLCSQSVKRGRGVAIFTAECSHTFHFPCIAGHVKEKGTLACPICGTVQNQNQTSVNDIQTQNHQFAEKLEKDVKVARMVADDDADKKRHKFTKQNSFKPDLKVYNDDESIACLTPKGRFNPIPESDENCDDEDSVSEFQGFHIDGCSNSSYSSNSLLDIDARGNGRNGEVEVRLLPEAAVISTGRGYETYAIALRAKAPSVRRTTTGRAPMDLVTVIDVSGKMSNEKLKMMKRTMRIIISSLTSSDRLSIVAFSSYSKRLLHLKRMTSSGQRAARRIVDAMAILEGSSNATDAVKKAAKVLEDRREKNTVASIFLLSDVSSQSSYVSTTRYCHSQSHLNVVVHSLKLTLIDEHAFAKSVTSLLTIPIQDLQIQLGFVSGSAPAEITSVFSYAPRPVGFGTGTGTVRLGELCANEERELLIELKVPLSGFGAHQVLLSVRCSYRDSVTQDDIYCNEHALVMPRQQTVRSSSNSLQRFRNLFITTRALAESRLLTARNDHIGAYHKLISARATLHQTGSGCSEFVVSLEAELNELQRRRQAQAQVQAQAESAAFIDEKGEPLTPISAWRVAEKLAKVAIMRKALNRVSDLHGFEDARF